MALELKDSQIYEARNEPSACRAFSDERLIAVSFFQRLFFFSCNLQQVGVPKESVS